MVSAALLAFFERALYYMELAERTAMEATVTNVNASLALHSARALLSGRSSSPPSIRAEMAGSPNFAGIRAASELGALPRGQWFFDPARDELVYLPRYRGGLLIDDPDQALRFGMKLDGKIYKLVPTNKFVWQ